MKCSKCGYLGFESGARCRNCGYDFSLAQPYDIPELTMRGAPAEPPQRDDYTLRDVATARPASRQTAALPLFVPAPADDADDAPLITKPSPPRAPLAVRRSTPDVARLRAFTTPKTSAALALDLQPTPAQPDPPPLPSPSSAAGASPAAIGPQQDAGVARRLVAAAVDALILIAVDLVVVYFTMQICGVGVRELGLLPKGPLVVFLLVQDLGYLVAFTAGGQTLGKMAAGIRVVADCDRSIDVSCAVKRTLMSLFLAVPAGLGLLPTLFDRQHRGLHDRFAGTRVVRASA